MVHTASQTLTLEEFLRLPETKPASEYVDGQVVQKPMPQGKRSLLQGELLLTLNSHLKPQHRARAFPELRCTFAGRSIVPDIAVFRWARIPRDEKGEVANAFSMAPDWTIEILSPEQNQTKVTKNILHCLKQGTEMGWLIDPAEQTLFIYRPQQEPEVLDELNQRLPVPAFAAGLELSIGEMFNWLLE
ncbi:MAG: Uma2 family endonuclease [Thermostichus sp. BF3_bins_97]